MNKAREKSPTEVALEVKMETFRQMAERAKDGVYRDMWTQRADDAEAKLAKLRRERR